MIRRNIYKKIAIIMIIASLFFAFSFLVSFSNNGAERLKRLNEDNNPFDDSEENGNGKGLNIDDLISFVQEATSKHLAILNEVLENAPASAQKGIARAIEVSTKGSIRAIETLNKIKPSNKDNRDNGQKTFHIISSCNHGGTIEPKGIQFSQGESVGFDITANAGYTLIWVRVDSEKLEAISSYSFDTIDSNHTIHAHFKKIKNSPTQNNEDD